MKIYLSPGHDPLAQGGTIELGRVEELHHCPTCGHEDPSRGNEQAYKAGRAFGDWVRTRVTGRFHDGLKDELNHPREEEAHCDCPDD